MTDEINVNDTDGRQIWRSAHDEPAKVWIGNEVQIQGTYRQCPTCGEGAPIIGPPRGPLTVTREDGKVCVTPHVEGCAATSEGP